MTMQPPWAQAATLGALDTKNLPEHQLCGVAAHEQLLKERDELRVVLDDLLQERNWAHRIGALQQAEREVRLHAERFWHPEPIRRALRLLSEALQGLPAHPAPAPQPPQVSQPEARPAPQEACCYTYVGDLGEIHQPNCTRQAEFWREQQNSGALGPIDVLTAFSRSMEAFQTLQRARTEAEPEAEVGAGAEARPTTDSTHE